MTCFEAECNILCNHLGEASRRQLRITYRRGTGVPPVSASAKDSQATFVVSGRAFGTAAETVRQG